MRDPAAAKKNTTETAERPSSSLLCHFVVAKIDVLLQPRRMRGLYKYCFSNTYTSIKNTVFIGLIVFNCIRNSSEDLISDMNSKNATIIIDQLIPFLLVQQKYLTLPGKGSIHFSYNYSFFVQLVTGHAPLIWS